MSKKSIAERLIRKVELKLDGKTWPLVVTHNVLIECEELTGLNLIAGEVNLLRPSAKLVRALLYVANVLLRSGNRAPARILLKTAISVAGILLFSNLPFLSIRLHAYLSALPLAVAGIGYALMQLRLRLARGVLLKRLLLAGTFVIWAVDQLLPSGRMAMFIGDVVIAAYVLDLYWLIQEEAAAVNASSDSSDRSA